MQWNENMAEAPAGEVRRVTVNRPDKPSYDLNVPIKHYVFGLSSQGTVIRTFWIVEQNRWSGFTEENPPVAWLAIPDHPLITALRERSTQNDCY